MTERSKLLRATAMAACIATLTACGGSPERPKAELPAPDPIVKRVVVREPFCPPELTAEIPPRVKAPAGMVMDATPETLGYVGDRFAREELLEKRLRDGQPQCPKGAVIQ